MNTRPDARAGKCAAAACLLLCCVAFPAFTQAQTCAPPANGDWKAWLDRQEQAGGHALKCHVGISANGLIGRLENRDGNKSGVCRPNGRQASAWSDVKSLIDALKPALPAQIDLAQDGDLQLSGSAARSIGQVVRAYDGKPDKNRKACPGNASYECEGTRDWTALVRVRDGQCFLLTAYPVP